MATQLQSNNPTVLELLERQKELQHQKSRSAKEPQRQRAAGLNHSSAAWRKKRVCFTAEKLIITDKNYGRTLIGIDCVRASSLQSDGPGLLA